jgi:hypothetical protein
VNALKLSPKLARTNSDYLPKYESAIRAQIRTVMTHYMRAPKPKKPMQPVREEGIEFTSRVIGSKSSNHR